MKRRTTILACAFAVCMLVLAGCASSAQQSSSSASDPNPDTIVVAATPTPHAEILNNVVLPMLADQGYNLQIEEYTDYVLPNAVTSSGGSDANFFQTIPYLDLQRVEQGVNLVDVAEVHIEPMRIYAGKTTNLAALPNGATVVVPNDLVNEARALSVLKAAGLIQLDEATNMPTLRDIKDNPRNLQFVEKSADAVTAELPNADIGVVNGNFALQAKLPETSVLFTEEISGNPYINVLVVKEGNESRPKIQALVKAITSKEVADYIEANYGGAVVPVGSSSGAGASSSSSASESTNGTGGTAESTSSSSAQALSESTSSSSTAQ